MKSALIKKLFLLPALAFVSLSLPSFVFSQSVDQVAYSLEIEGNGQAGQVVTVTEGKYTLSQQEYDPGIYGVIVNDPALNLNVTTENTKYVVISGQVNVLVSIANGEIKRGDLVTTSKDIGIAQKATRSGHVLGKALDDFPKEGDDASQGLVPVLLNINYNQVSAQSESLTDAGLDQVADKVANAFVSGNLPDLLKYIFALLLGIISFFVGLYHFVRSNRTAVESIARNPLAKKEIQKQLIIGTAGIVFISAVGMGISVWILFFL